MKPGKRNQKYSQNIRALRNMLESMLHIENYFYYMADTRKLNILNMQWFTEDAEIEISEYVPEKDLFNITIYVFPAKAEEYLFVEYIRYFYTVSGNSIKRKLIVTPEAPPLYSEGKKVLEELMSILSFNLGMDVVIEESSY